MIRFTDVIAIGCVSYVLYSDYRKEKKKKEFEIQLDQYIKTNGTILKVREIEQMRKQSYMDSGIQNSSKDIKP